MVLMDLFAYSIEDAEHQTATRRVGDPHLGCLFSSMGGIETR